MKTHLYRGVVGGGRFAITACSEPKHFQKFAYTTRYIADVSCKKCLEKIDKNKITQAMQDALPGDAV